MKIIITGSAGYIGSCLFEHLKKKHKVFGVDKVLPKLKKQKNFIHCNLLNFDKVDFIIRTIKPDIIIHLAAVSHSNRSNKNPFSTFDHSLRTLENVLDASKNRNIHLIYFLTNRPELYV